jgi:hypothetical protein
LLQSDFFSPSTFIHSFIYLFYFCGTPKVSYLLDKHTTTWATPRYSWVSLLLVWFWDRVSLLLHKLASNSWCSRLHLLPILSSWDCKYVPLWPDLKRLLYSPLVLRLELRTSLLLGRCKPTSVTPLALFAVFILDRVSHFALQLWSSQPQFAK